MYAVILVIATFLLVSCVGGGGGDDDAPAVAPPAPNPSSTFQVEGVSPEPGQMVMAFPQQIRVTFSRNPDPAAVGNMTFMVFQSGGDDNFTSGNETELTANSIAVVASIVTMDFAGTNLQDELFQLRVAGEGANALVDTTGEALDGDGNGAAGGNFASNFRVDPAMPDPATLSQIQANILTPNCTFSGCHSGVSPAAGMNLTAGQAFTNIVGVASSEVPALQRIESGNPDDSYLIRKIEGTASVGSRMPLNRTPLSSAQIATIRAWVSRGAMND